jgi:ribokinase
MNLEGRLRRKLAVVGHVEWMSFVAVKHLPKAGTICHATASREEPAGGGAVAALQLARLTNEKVSFFTALGRDELGEKAAMRLKQLGLDLHVAWRDAPTRKGISFVDSAAERTITVIGERLAPLGADPLPWHLVGECDGVFVTATDAAGLRFCRRSALLTATPRLSLEVLEKSGVCCDALIGSALDPGELVPEGFLSKPPLMRIGTEGAAGGWYEPGGRYSAIPLEADLVDSYGCGDSFAAGVTAGLAAGWSPLEAIGLGARCGAECATTFGPFAEFNDDH